MIQQQENIKPVVLSKESIYELQKIDCNCNECSFMERDIERFNKSVAWHTAMALEDFTRRKEKAIADASNVLPEHGREGMLRVAHKMKFQFSKDGLIAYGTCLKLNKPVTFIVGVCQLETQHCFVHRKDSAKK